MLVSSIDSVSVKEIYDPLLCICGRVKYSKVKIAMKSAKADTAEKISQFTNPPSVAGLVFARLKKYCSVSLCNPGLVHSSWYAV